MSSSKPSDKDKDSPSPISFPRGSCCLGQVCMNFNQELRVEHTCPDCHLIVHILCGEFDHSLEKYVCNPCWNKRGKTASVPGKPPGTETSPVKLPTKLPETPTSPPMVHSTVPDTVMLSGIICPKKSKEDKFTDDDDQPPRIHITIPPEEKKPPHPKENPKE